jgi:alpha-tubulin suppressor-like RCC1 family protein
MLFARDTPFSARHEPRALSHHSSDVTHIHSGVAKCWGSNFNFELGNGMGAGFTSNVAVNVSNLTMPAAIASGTSHSCARRTNGGLRCWGSGQGGELGDGQSSDSNVPVTVTTFP